MWINRANAVANAIIGLPDLSNCCQVKKLLVKKTSAEIITWQGSN